MRRYARDIDYRKLRAPVLPALVESGTIVHIQHVTWSSIHDSSWRVEFARFTEYGGWTYGLKNDEGRFRVMTQAEMRTVVLDEAAAKVYQQTMLAALDVQTQAA